MPCCRRPVLLQIPDRVPSDPGRVTRALAAFQDLVTSGGADTAFFLDDEHRLIGQDIRHAAARTPSNRLKGALLEGASTWDRAFATAPPDLGPQVVNLKNIGASFPPEYERRRGEVAEVARDGLDQCERGLARLNAEEAGSRRERAASV